MSIYVWAVSSRAPTTSFTFWSFTSNSELIAISHGACEVAQRVDAAAIVSATFSGATARAVARHLPSQPIVAVSPNRRFALTAGRRSDIPAWARDTRSTGV